MTNGIRRYVNIDGVSVIELSDGSKLQSTDGVNWSPSSKAECPACGKEDPPEVHTCSPQVRICPECGANGVKTTNGYVGSLETSWKYCFDCGWQGAPE